jgi:GR25 family glycosyltransferase involved in LPS biosynthesis
MTLKKYIHSNIELIVFFLLVSILAYLLIRRSWEGFFTEQNGINQLDAIIYINLEARNDRKDLVLKELEKLNTDMSKVYKVSGVYMPKNGHKGCIQSHILALNMIKLNNWNRVLILEDDAELNMTPETINSLINKSLEELDKNYPEWNVIMLATANKIIDKDYNKINKLKNELNKKPLPIDLDIYANKDKTNSLKLEKLKKATTSSAYIVKKEYADNILNLFNHCNNNMSPKNMSSKGYEHWALDQKWAELQKNNMWFCIDKDPIKQRAIWSTIQSDANKK